MNEIVSRVKRNFFKFIEKIKERLMSQSAKRMQKHENGRIYMNPFLIKRNVVLFRILGRISMNCTQLLLQLLLMAQASVV